MATIHRAEQALTPRFYPPPIVMHELFIFPILARRMDHIITVSRTSSRYLRDRLHIPADRISLCPNAMGSGYRVLQQSDLSAKRKYGTGDAYFFHVSRFSERKNPWTILRGFERFLRAQKGAPFKLVLAGSGWDNPRVKRSLASHNLQHHVILPGFIPENEVVELLNGATAFLFPSFAEGFGMPNLEAMAYGCPVITTSVFAIPEIVGDSALLMENPADFLDLSQKMRVLVEDRALRTKLVEKGLKRAGLFSWKQSVQTLMSVYERLTSLLTP